jgi:uracil-DNA glycosylase
VTDAEERRERLIELYREARDCHRCPLAETRTQVVFGAGNANADLMFVGEAPGQQEDLQGIPFVGRAGKLLDELLAENGLRRDDVFIANVLKCLRYNALVQLGDGSWERIGRLVRSRYDGDVMSVASDGTLQPRRIVGWHATPLGDRRVFRLTYGSAKRAGASQSAIQLTGDHPVLTERGYVSVEDLRDGDRIATGQGLSELAWDVACGTLLGDGTLNASSSYLGFGHSAKQTEYALFKAKLLTELQPRVSQHRVAAVSGGDRSHPVIHVRTRAHRALRTLRDDFYRPLKSVPEWLEESLNERMLAFWFMDDGHMRIRPPRRPSAEICSQGFDTASLQVLRRALYRLGIPVKISPIRTLRLDVTATERLSALIAPYVPRAMRHKLHPEVEARVPFDPTLLRPGPPRTMFDGIMTEEVTDEPRGDTTFFCIDVEETHNFVTAGGVVHNCRPPGNRDPEPAEIEACKPYLFRQVELIEPTVICTLGNFATKLLTGSQVGITRVHGSPQVHTLGERTVQIFPIFHPAAGLRTPSVKELLREDFKKLPGLLAAGPPPQEGAPAAPPAPEPAVEEATEPSADQLDLFG